MNDDNISSYLRTHDNVLPKIIPLPANDGLKQLLVADVNILIGDDIFEEKSTPFDDIICVLGDERREIVMNTIAIAETQIRARLRDRVPARRQQRGAAAAQSDDTADAERLRALNARLTKKIENQAEVAASEAVMRIMSIAQSTGKELASSIDVLKSIIKEVADQSARFGCFELKIENLCFFSHQINTQPAQDDNDDDYVADLIWTTPVVDEDVVVQPLVLADVPMTGASCDDLLTDTDASGGRDEANPILPEANDE
jgi:hypothetical protein